MSTAAATPHIDRRQRKRQLAGLCTAHVLADGYASFVTPLLSTLAGALGVSYEAVSALVGFNQLSAAVANIVVGLGIDRWRALSTKAVIVAATVTVSCMSMIGVVSHYWLLAAVMIVGVFACGSFHPPAFSLAGEISYPDRHHGVSIVMAVGIASCGLGPIFVSQVVRHGGLRATPWCLVPGLTLAAFAAFLLRRTGQCTTPKSVTQQADDGATPAPRTPVLWIALLFANAALRTFGQTGILVIVSLLTEEVWHQSVASSGIGIGCLQIGAGLGGLLGARLTRSGNERLTLLWCTPINLIFLVPMAMTTGRIWYAWLFFYGLAINGPGAVVVGMAQRVAPHRSALVSGLMIGPVGAVGGFLAAMTTPHLVRNYGQATTMAFLALPLVLSFLVAWPLPVDEEASSD